MSIVKISIITSSNRYMNMSVGDVLFKPMMSIFKKNEKGNVLYKQFADREFRDKLELLSELSIVNPKVLGIINYLKKIKNNEFFLLLNFHIEDLETYLFYKHKVDLLNDNTEDVYSLEDFPVSKYYRVYVYGNDGAECHIGEKDKKKRICRFCGKSEPEVKFGNRSHAISEFLGNKKLYCNEECDVCNLKLSKIEQELNNLLAPLLSLYQVKGKDGVRNFTSKVLTIDNKTQPKPFILFNKVKGQFPTSVKELDGFSFETQPSEYKYVAQNIYKCLCKYALSVLDRKYISEFSETIEWITLDKFVDSLPNIWMTNSSTVHISPAVGIYVRKEESEEIPYIFAKLLCVNIEYVFIIPFSTKDKPYFSKDFASLNENFTLKLKEWFPSSTYCNLDLSSKEPAVVAMSVELNIPEGSENGVIIKRVQDIEP